MHKSVYIAEITLRPSMSKRNMYIQEAQILYSLQKSFIKEIGSQFNVVVSTSNPGLEETIFSSNIYNSLSQ